ncbi:MAG: hypothetical protein ABR499_05210 [Gemmatimonadaceae bacterium]
MTPLRPTFTTLAALAAAALAPALAHAQQQQGATPAGAPTASTTAVATPLNAAAEQALKQMTGKLRSVLAAQEQHYSDHGTYTTSMTALGKYDTGLSPARANTGRRDSVSVQVIFAGGRGWTGIASHWGLRGKSCVVYVGIADELPKLPITRADRKTPTEESVPICDTPPATPAGAAPQPAPQPAPAPTQPPGRQ